MKNIDASAQAVINLRASQLNDSKTKLDKLIRKEQIAGRLATHPAFNTIKTVRPRFFSRERKTIGVVWLIVTYLGMGDLSYKALLGADGNLYNKWGVLIDMSRLSQYELNVGTEQFKALFGKKKRK